MSQAMSDEVRAPRPLYDDAAYYRMLFRERTHDLPFYERATERHRTVLELGVGDGRVAFALATIDREVTGIDLSPTMLAALEERRRDAPLDARARVVTECADLRRVRLERAFDAVICPFNGLAHASTREDQHAFFATVRHHLKGGGHFAFDVLVPDPELLRGGGSSVPRFEHPETGRVARMEEHYEYDALAQVLTIVTEIVDRETEARQVLSLVLRQWFPEETKLLLEHHGFELLAREELGDSLGYVTRIA